MEIFTTEKQERSLVGLRLNKKILEKFRELCKAERRDYNAQMELILEDWFAQREKPKAPKVYGPGFHKEHLTRQYRKRVMPSAWGGAGAEVGV